MWLNNCVFSAVEASKDPANWHLACIRNADATARINPAVLSCNGVKKMIKTLAKQLLSTTLSLLLVVAAMPFDAQAQQAGYSGQGAPLSAEELQQLVAPIALYPDSLVAQILGAATFPDQIPGATSWLQQNS